MIYIYIYIYIWKFSRGFFSFFFFFFKGQAYQTLFSVKGVWWKWQPIGKQFVTKELGEQGRGEQQWQRNRGIVCWGDNTIGTSHKTIF